MLVESWAKIRRQYYAGAGMSRLRTMRSGNEMFEEFE